LTTVLPNQRKCNRGVLNAVEDFNVTYFYLPSIGNIAKAKPGLKSEMALGYAGSYGLTQVPDEIRLTLRKQSVLKTKKVLIGYVNLATLVYQLATCCSHQDYFRIFFRNGVYGAPRRIVSFGHSLGGGMAQLLNAVLQDRVYCENVLDPDMRMLIGDIFPQKSWFPQCFGVTLACYSALGNEAEKMDDAQHISIVATDGILSKDFIAWLDLIGPLTYDCVDRFPVTVSVIKAYKRKEKKSIWKKIKNKTIGKVVSAVDFVVSEAQSLVGIDRPLLLSNLVVAGVSAATLSVGAGVALTVATGLVLHDIRNYSASLDKDRRLKDRIGKLFSKPLVYRPAPDFVIGP